MARVIVGHILNMGGGAGIFDVAVPFAAEQMVNPCRRIIASGRVVTPSGGIGLTGVYRTGFGPIDHQLALVEVPDAIMFDERIEVKDRGDHRLRSEPSTLTW